MSSLSSASTPDTGRGRGDTVVEEGGRAEVARDREMLDLAVKPSVLDLGVTLSTLDLGDRPGDPGRDRTRVGDGTLSRFISVITGDLDNNVGLSASPGLLSSSLFETPAAAASSVFLVLESSSRFFSRRTWDRRLS